FVFFFQAEDGIRDRNVTGVQTCALPIFTAEIRALAAKNPDELYVAAKELQAPYSLVQEIAETGSLPVVLFTAGGVATPSDAAMRSEERRVGKEWGARGRRDECGRRGRDR